MCPTRGHFIRSDVADSSGVAAKEAISFEEQLGKLKSRGLFIGDEEKCLDFLRSVNYYRFTAYLLPFKQKDGTYIPGTTFDRVFQIYEFDRKLRTLLFSIIEEIELYLRSQLAYYFAHTYGPLAHLKEEYYNGRHNHRIFMKTVDSAVKNNKNTLVVKHHAKKYKGLLPIWVIVDFMSIGNLSYFYCDWQIDDKKFIARELFKTTYPYLDSWMKCLTVLRNRCAHYSRLYFAYFTDNPRMPKHTNYICTGRVFDHIIMLKFLYPHHDSWNVRFIAPLQALVDEYGDSIDFAHIGFPDDWMRCLV